MGTNAPCHFYRNAVSMTKARKVQVSAEREATRIIGPRFAVVVGTDHHRRSDLGCP